MRPKAIFPWRRSASASRQVADRLRQRRRGSKERRKSPARAAPASGRSHSESPSPATTPIAIRGRVLPEAPTLCSPLPADVPTPTALASPNTSPSQSRFELPPSPSEPRQRASDTGSEDDSELATWLAAGETLFPAARCCSAPPLLPFNVPPAAAAVPSPRRLSPCRRLSPASAAPSPKVSSGRAPSPSAIPPLPAIPPSVRSPDEVSHATPELSGSISAVLESSPWNSRGSPFNSGSPTILDLIGQQGLWPPTASTTRSRSWPWPPSPSKAPGGASSDPSSPKEGCEEQRLREAQQLLAQMLAGTSGCDDIGRSRRRTFSAPSLGRPVALALGARTRPSAAAAAAVVRSSLAQQSLPALRPVSDWVAGERSPVPRATYAAAQREASTSPCKWQPSTPSLKPINGSMPHFPNPSRDAALQPGLLRGGPRRNTE